jgi:hypothetical protein
LQRSCNDACDLADAAAKPVDGSLGDFAQAPLISLTQFSIG